MKTISPQLLLWTELLVLWSFAAYGIAADPLKEEANKFPWTAWTCFLVLRAILFGVLSYVIAGSVGLSGVLAIFVVAQPLIRYRMPIRWVAEFECLWVLLVLTLSAGYVWHFKLASHWWPPVLREPQAGAVFLTIAILIFIVRGGTYIVRGILRKAGTLPSQASPAIVAEGATLETSPAIDKSFTLSANSESAAEVEILNTSELQFSIDVKELNRGRLIGNLERIVLTIVVAAGSYSALGFLIAAKGLVRFEEFEKSREFTEYFLVGSLSSVLVALCAGLILRHALLVLWPELLAFQMQG